MKILDKEELELQSLESKEPEMNSLVKLLLLLYVYIAILHIGHRDTELLHELTLHVSLMLLLLLLYVYIDHRDNKL